jgi:hypothetical protein
MVEGRNTEEEAKEENEEIRRKISSSISEVVKKFKCSVFY